MPTAYIKKLAKLNHTTVNKIEKFWAQAKEIAKSEGNGKAWGLITTIFQNKLKKEGYKVGAFTSLADTDELDDADLGINVDPKEYHKQKSLQMSLQSKLDMIKEDLNKEADEYNEELVQWAKELNKRNRRTYADDNRGDNWLVYNGPVNKEVLIKAWKEGAYYDGRDKRKKEKLKEFENGMLKTYLKLLNKKEIVVYRGLNFFKYFSKDKTNLNKALKYFKYNLIDRNSWTISKQKAEAYSNQPYPKYGVILKMTCSLEDVNLPLSAYLEGAWSWFFFNNREVNLRKSFNVKNIEVIQAGEKFENLVSSKVVAFKEETREVDDRKFIFKRLSLADTDELDDADLGLNVDPKEYHKQKSLQMSLQSKLDMIKKDINKETKQNIDELRKVAKKLNKTNRRKWTNDNNGDKWLNYKGPVNEEVILKAFADGHYNNSDESYYKDRPDVLSFKNSSIFKTYQRLLKNKPVILYRGLHFKDDSDLKRLIHFLKYNLMDRNSWTTSIGKAKVYSKIGNPKCSIVLKIECTLDKINLPLSAWLEGSWFLEQNREVNLKKSFEVEDISIVDYTGDVGSLVKQFNKAVAKVKGTDMKTYIYKNKRITASSKEEAIQQIVATKQPKMEELLLKIKGTLKN